jgi:DNA-binding NarL/FixJ family response regulator
VESCNFRDEMNINIEALKELLKTKNMKQAALHLCVPYSSLHDFCSKNGIKRDSPSKRGRESKAENHIDEIISLYAQGYTQIKIAEKLGLSKTTINTILNKAKHHMRTRSESCKLRDAEKGEEKLKQQAAMANAVRRAMGVLNIFNF